MTTNEERNYYYMAYTDKAYFLTKIKEGDLNELLKDEAGTVKDAYLTDAIKSADDKMNGYLRSKLKAVPVPAEKITDTIKQHSFDIAMYYLHDRIQFVDIPDRIVRKYDDAIAWLKDVVSGKVDLGITEDTEETVPGINYFGETNIFGRDSF